MNCEVFDEILKYVIFIVGVDSLLLSIFLCDIGVLEFINVL